MDSDSDKKLEEAAEAFDNTDCVQDADVDDNSPSCPEWKEYWLCVQHMSPKAAFIAGAKYRDKNPNQQRDEALLQEGWDGARTGKLLYEHCEGDAADGYKEVRFTHDTFADFLKSRAKK